MIVGKGSGMISTLRANAGMLKKKRTFRDIRQKYINEIKTNSDNLDSEALHDFQKSLISQRKKEAFRSIVFLLISIAIITIVLLWVLGYM